MLRFLLRCLILTLGLAPLPPAQSSHAPVPLVSVPFESVGGILVLRNLAFNGLRGDFILDTGCTYALVVEQAAFPSQLRPSKFSGLSAVGAIAQYELPVTQFEFGAVRPPQVAQATSLAALRPLVGPRLLGLVGTGLLRRFEVVIDYAHRRLSCYELGPQASSARLFTRRDSLAFTLVKGWPITQARIGAVPVSLLLDTGARENLLDADLAHALPAAVRPTGTQLETVVGPAGRTRAQRAVLPRLQLGPIEWRNLPVLLTAPVRYQSGRALPYQGLLGRTFLGQEPLVSFHFGRGYLYFLRPRP
ncbi:clan AA aspartic protease [Hymenobacter sp. RP-2-7]|uniref:Clan AA aspartic protease n=1 Tax=Hymenobacter polaris TaxID=2682546 RepID=A0A7Y0AIE6_9BACT|nr:retropepsin-like aspartic protease [Hymenobacter polaris]NML67941.1 clan AA aspartic protease [Hymenobacter polaris]